MKKRVVLMVVPLMLLITSFSHAEGPRRWSRSQPVPDVWLTPNDFGNLPIPQDIQEDSVNIRINSDSTTQIQNEQQIWINPHNTDNVVAMWRDFRLGYRRIGVGFSVDGGETWVDSLFAVTGRPWHSDPGLTIDAAGNFYAIYIAFEPDESASGFEVLGSTDGGASWQGPTLAIDGVPNVFEDKEMMACDRAPDSPYQGNLYVAWTRFSHRETQTDCDFIRSIDGNRTWSSAMTISDNSGLQWPLPVVGAGGVVYVAWISFVSSAIVMDRSFDGGVTWGQDGLVTSVYRPTDIINGDITVFSFPAMDADITGGERHGNLYMAYMDWTSRDYDIYFKRSEDQGETWSRPVRINDDELNNSADQFHPWLTVDENGAITVMFYDRRNDEAHNLLYDIYFTQSFDGGNTWTPNQRVTTESSNPTVGGDILAGLIGEYSGVSVRDGIAQFVWTDFRNGNQDTYTARLHTYVPTSVSDDNGIIPTRPLLVSNYPNPFNSSTNIRFNLPYRTGVHLSVFDVAGKKVGDIADRQFDAGNHSVSWTPDNLSTGIYFVRLKTDNATSSKKVVYLK